MTETTTFAKMSSLKPDFFINLGDLHYAGTNRTVEEQFAFAYHEVFKSNAMREFYQTHPLVYTFDDHDVGDNNADGLTISSTEVNKVYRDVVPHYPLGGGKGKGIWQEFTVGGVLFMVLDLRSFKNTKNTLTNRTTNLGHEQLMWLNQTLERAAGDDDIKGVVLLMSFPWHSAREWNP